MPMDEREQAELFEHEARVQAEHDALTGRVRTLEHEIEALTGETDEQIRALTAERDRLAARVAELDGQRDRVMEVHVNDARLSGHCGHCLELMPCTTIRALDGEAPRPEVAE